MDQNKNSIAGDVSEKITTKNNTVQCHSREIPLWLVLLFI